MQVVEPRRSDAFAEFYTDHKRSALRLAYLLTGDGELAEEVVANVFVRLYPKHTTIEEPAGYIRRAIINEVNSTFRKFAVRRRYAETHRSSDAAAADSGVDDRDAVQRALLMLPVRQRAAVAMRYLDDLSEADTATALGVSVGTVKAQVSRGLDRLREILDAKQEGDAR